MSMLNAAYDLGGKWRREAEEAPVLDVRSTASKVPQKARHSVPALSLHAVLTRDVGYFTHPERLLPDQAYERCFHFALAYGAVHHWEQRHDMTQAFCEGAFGIWLPAVMVQGPGEKAAGAMRGDAFHDRWRFRLFVAPDWKTPIQPKVRRILPAYVTWAEYQDAVKRRDAA